MKLKTDRFMWLKSIKENKSTALYWGYLAIIGVIFYWMNLFTPLYCDDWHYCFIYGTGLPIESLGDIFKSQYTHYFEMNGRFIPHFFVQLFDGILGKELFNIINTLFLMAFMYLLSNISGKNNQLENLSIASFLIFLLLPGFKICFLWMSGACNYLWVGVFILIFNKILMKETRINPIYYPLLFILGIFCGWTHEGIIIGLCAGYIIYFLIHKNKLNITRLILLSGLFLGAAFLVFSPGSINRALGSNSGDIFNWKVYMTSLLHMNNLRIMFILLLVLFILYKQKYTKRILQENIHWIIGIIISFIFIVLTKFWAAHSRFGIELFSLIIILKLIVHKIPKSINIVTTIITITILSLSIKPCYSNYNSYQNALSQIQNGDSLISIQTNKNKCHYLDRFILDFIFLADGVKSTWYDGFISKYYNKDLIFIPQHIINNICDNKIDFQKPYTNQNLGYYIIKTDKQYNNIHFILEPTDINKLPFYLKPLANKMQKYTATSIQAKEFRTICICNESYLLIQKNENIDNRVKDFTFE